MAVTEQDKHAKPVSGESTSGGPKKIAVTDNGEVKVVSVGN